MLTESMSQIIQIILYPVSHIIQELYIRDQLETKISINRSAKLGCHKFE